jgi:hypothetical protein
MSSYSYNDAIYNLTPEKARKARDQLTNELEYNRQRLIVVQNRRHKILKKLDKEILDIEEQIGQIRNTIEEIDKCHFGMEYDELL